VLTITPDRPRDLGRAPQAPDTAWTGSRKRTIPPCRCGGAPLRTPGGRRAAGCRRPPPAARLLALLPRSPHSSLLRAIDVANR
jgi:hypothetical protein